MWMAKTEAQSTVVTRGTRNGRTVTRLLQRAGAAAVTGPKGASGSCKATGSKVFPDNAVGGTSEDGGKNGGYTVAVYGSNMPDGRLTPSSSNTLSQ